MNTMKHFLRDTHLFQKWVLAKFLHNLLNKKKNSPSRFCTILYQYLHVTNKVCLSKKLIGSLQAEKRDDILDIKDHFSFGDKKIEIIYSIENLIETMENGRVFL